jgi:hypothetical protein
MKKLATLEVYLDESPGQESSYTRHVSVGAPYEIILRPQADRAEKLPVKEEDVLAHELGHFVTDVFRSYRGDTNGNKGFTTEQQLTEERQAWHFAEIIKPDVDRQVEKTVLGHYEELVRRAPGIPVGFLKWMGYIQ